MSTENATRRPLCEAQRLFDELGQIIQRSKSEFWWFEIGSTPLEVCLHRDEIAGMREIFLRFLLDPDCSISATPHLDEPDETEE